MLELKIDKSKMICKKLLSDAEILCRRKKGTNQTHIGLYEQSVPLDRINIPSLLIYSNDSYDTLTLMDPITTPDGLQRSPKTRQGKDENELFFEDKKYESTYGKINEIIKNEDDNSRRVKDFFIIWGTLTNGRLFFILYYDENSNTNILHKYLSRDEIFSDRLKGYPNANLHKKLLESSEEILKSYDLEKSVTEAVDSINAGVPTNRFFTKEEWSTAQEVGKLGESLIEKYLIDKKQKNQIKDFYWLSKVHPSADHDFEITDLNDQVKWIEVKSTLSEFKKPFFWSRNERRLFVKDPQNYLILRVCNVFDINKVCLHTTENMLVLRDKLDIEGIEFEGSTVLPDKIDINWSDAVSLKKYY